MEFTILSLTTSLMNEYSLLFSKAEVLANRKGDLETAYKKLMANKARYEAVGKNFATKANPNGLPYYFIGSIHMRESYFDFTKHLHNGDSLLRKTVNVPANRPAGNPPYTWEYSAQDALQLCFSNKQVWRDAIAKPLTTQSLLQMLEMYNGLGYRPVILRERAIPSPYLWAASNIQLPGKYISDGKFSSTTFDKQLGAAILMKHCIQQEQKKK